MSKISFFQYPEEKKLFRKDITKVAALMIGGVVILNSVMSGLVGSLLDAMNGEKDSSGSHGLRDNGYRTEQSTQTSGSEAYAISNSAYIVSKDENWDYVNSLYQVPVTQATSSTYLTSSKGVEYVAANCVDGNIETSWQEGVDGNGEGSFLTFSFDGEHSVSYLIIRNGNAKNNDKYKANNRPCNITIVSDSFSYTLDLEDINDFQIVKLDGFRGTYMSFTINSVYPGASFTDTCISEISFWE